MVNITLKNDRLNGGELKYNHLLGKQFKLGTTDCYNIARCMFKDNLNINLTNYARPKLFWRYDDMNIYVDNFRNEGFELIDDVTLQDLRPFDCFLIAIPDPRSIKKTMTNHCAVYLTNGWVIHHRYGQLSKLEQYRGALRNFTTHTIRHKDVPDMRDKKQNAVDLMSLIPAHKRAELQEALNAANANSTT